MPPNRPATLHRPPVASLLNGTGARLFRIDLTLSSQMWPRNQEAS